jgi:transposase-like protein
MMTDDTMTLLLDQIQASTDGDFLRAIAAHTLQRLMEFEVDGLIGAGRHERSDERTTYRNGYRERQLETRLGTLDLRIPKLRQGSYFPAFLEPRKTAEKALTAVIQEAWIQGVSTRKVDDLVQALGMTGISKRRSRRCARTSTRACCPSSSGRWTASGPTSGSMRPTSRSARMAASCRSPP